MALSGPYTFGTAVYQHTSLSAYHVYHFAIRIMRMHAYRSSRNKHTVQDTNFVIGIHMRGNMLLAALETLYYRNRYSFEIYNHISNYFGATITQPHFSFRKRYSAIA